MRLLVTASCALSALTLAGTASAFCGFYVGGSGDKLANEATQVVLMRQGTRTVLSMQNAYKGPPQGFAMVVPVPVVLQKDQVKTLTPALFDKVEQLDAPRLVEYWEEDPCEPERIGLGNIGTIGHGSGTGQGFGSGSGRLHGVTVEAQFAVGEYEIVILSAKDSSGLDEWLKENKYAIPDGAEPVLRPYVAAGMKFFVAKVDVTKVHFEDGRAVLSPLRFQYDAETFSLPVRLGLLNSAGTQDLIVHILANGQRYEAANYKNVTMPTNLDVDPRAKADFAPFYAALFDRVVEKNPRTVVTEYSWDAGACDPCPGPTLTPADLATLGGDALPGDAGAPSSSRRGGSRMTLTRLHMRYAKDALGEDLIFRTAPPIVGGHEFMETFGDGGMRREEGSRPDVTNNFQARYAIRHPWTGPITCASPVRGRWGEPWPDAGPPFAGPQAATKTAFAPRGSLQLATYVDPKLVPELDLAGYVPPPPPPQLLPAPDAAAAPSATAKTGGCGSCSAGGAGDGGSLAVFFTTALLVVSRLRRKGPR